MNAFFRFLPKFHCTFLSSQQILLYFSRSSCKNLSNLENACNSVLHVNLGAVLWLQFFLEIDIHHSLKLRHFSVFKPNPKSRRLCKTSRRRMLCSSSVPSCYVISSKYALYLERTQISEKFLVLSIIQMQFYSNEIVP